MLRRLMLLLAAASLSLGLSGCIVRTGPAHRHQAVRGHGHADQHRHRHCHPHPRHGQKCHDHVHRAGHH